MPFKSIAEIFKTNQEVSSKSKNIKQKFDLKFIIQCEKPIEDDLFKLPNFVLFLNERIKYKGQTGQLKLGGIEVKQDDTQVIVTSKTALSKRYLKYLTKKYIKSNSLRDWIRVIANGKEAYEMRYFNIENDDSNSECSD